MRTSDVLMDVKLLVLATVLVLSGTIAAEAQQGFLFQFSFFAKPVPPVDIPMPSSADAGAGVNLSDSGPSETPSGGTPAEQRASTSQEAPAATKAGDEPTTAAAAVLSLASVPDSQSDSGQDDALKALEAAADAGQPIALWRLGTMYESGKGVQKDDVRAFGYFSRIANENANTPPSSLEADIVAQSFVKVGEYYRAGLPDAGIAKDSQRSVALLMHAATYFADAQAQYEIGQLYLNGESLGQSALQGARWLSLAARKGHVAAQATLGDLLFNGEGLEAQPVEGLMWLTIAHEHADTADAPWVDELLNKAMSVATPDQRSAAIEAADTIGPQVSGG
jgi:uncharacterized protein